MSPWVTCAAVAALLLVMDWAHRNHRPGLVSAAAGTAAFAYAVWAVVAFESGDTVQGWAFVVFSAVLMRWAWRDRPRPAGDAS